MQNQLHLEKSFILTNNIFG